MKLQSESPFIFADTSPPPPHPVVFLAKTQQDIAQSFAVCLHESKNIFSRIMSHSSLVAFSIIPVGMNSEDSIAHMLTCLGNASNFTLTSAK